MFLCFRETSYCSALRLFNPWNNVIQIIIFISYRALVSIKADALGRYVLGETRVPHYLFHSGTWIKVGGLPCASPFQRNLIFYCTVVIQSLDDVKFKKNINFIIIYYYPLQKEIYACTSCNAHFGRLYQVYAHWHLVSDSRYRKWVWKKWETSHYLVYLWA